MCAGAGGTMGVQIGSAGMGLVNSGAAAATDKVLVALKQLTDLPIRYIIDADAGADFVGGNEKLARAGYTIFTNALGNPAALQAMTGGGASILSHASVLRRRAAAKPAYPRNAQPNQPFFQPANAIRMNHD